MQRLFAAAIVLLAVGCGSKNSPTSPPPPAGSAGSMSARIDGVPWSSRFITVSPQGAITALGADGSPSLLMIGESALGTYRIAPGQLPLWTAILYQSVPGGPTWLAGLFNVGSGSVEITTASATRLAGTFSFVLHPPPPGIPFGTGAIGTKTVTEGTFDVAR
jgi:hypothetical protein